MNALTRIFLPTAAVLFLVAPAGAGTLQFERAVTGARSDPFVDLAQVPGAPDKVALLRLQTGDVVIYDRRTGSLAPTPLLTGAGVPGETLVNTLSLAFAPDFQTSGKLYVGLVTVDPGDRNMDSNHVLEYTVNPSTLTADPASRRSIMRIDHPVNTRWIGHNGSDMDFGPTDGMLYITVGESDVGLPGEADAPAVNPAQDVTDRLGSVLRVDVSGDAYPDDPDNNYAIPADNPDFGPGADPSLWAIGLRNPFRASFDAVNGHYIIADVGEDLIEEINIGVAGANYGWPAFEGDDAFAGPLAPVGDLTGPAFAYGHGDGLFEGISITGGVVYFGDLVALRGRYLFGDRLQRGDQARLWTVTIGADGTVTDARVWLSSVDAGAYLKPLAFGMTDDGALFALGSSGDLFQLVGAQIPLPAGAPLLATALALLVAWRAGSRRAAVG